MLVAGPGARDRLCALPLPGALDLARQAGFVRARAGTPETRSRAAEKGLGGR